MKVCWAIAKKELKSLFSSPIAYASIGVFLFINGLGFWLMMSQGAPASMEPISGWMSTILLLIAPFLTMRLIAEEYQSGAVELLYTSPITTAQIVLGKYLAIVSLLLIMLTLSLQYPIFLIAYGAPDHGPIVTSYIGIFLLGAVMLAIGMFASSLTNSQMVAALLGFAFLLSLWIVEAMGIAMPQYEAFFKAISMPNHYENMNRGVLNSMDIYFFLAMIFGFVFLTVKSVEARRG